MATKAEYLVNKTVNDANALLAQLEAAKTTARRITERMLGVGYVCLMSYDWPEGYTLNEDFLALYTAIEALPGSVVPDATRAALYKLVATFQ